MKKLIFILLLFVSLFAKAQIRPLYGQDTINAKMGNYIYRDTPTSVTHPILYNNHILGFDSGRYYLARVYTNGTGDSTIYKFADSSVIPYRIPPPTITDTLAHTIYSQTNAVLTPKFTLVDSTAATSGLQQWSPAMYLEGRGWTTSSVSKTAIWAVYNKTLSSGGTSSDGNLTFDFYNGTSFTNRFTLAGSTGGLTLTGSGSGLTCTGNSSLGNTTASVFTTGSSAFHTTSTDGFTARNPTSATNVNQQEISPRIRFTGQAWTGAASQVTDYIIENIPVNGTSPVTSFLKFSAQINAGGYNEVFRISNTGATKGGSFNMMASADSTSQTASDANVVTYASGATDSTYHVGGRLTVTSVSGGTVKLSVTYTDESNTSRTVDFFSMGTTTAALGATGVSSFPVLEIRVKASTSIVVATTVTGTITYNAGVTIIKIR